jgi:hypothetical protein
MIYDTLNPSYVGALPKKQAAFERWIFGNQLHSLTRKPRGSDVGEIVTRALDSHLLVFQ